MWNRWRAIFGLHFVDNLRDVLSHSGSFWCQVIGLVTMILPEAIFELYGTDTNPVFWFLSGFFLLIAGTFGRLLKQDKRPWVERLRVAAVILLAILAAFLLSGRAIAAPASERETLAIAVPFIMQEEGIRLVAYRDIVGIPTICGGLTSASGIAVTMGMTMTMAECTGHMWRKVAEYRNGLHRYFTLATINQRLPPERDTAYTSLAFNAGIPSIGASTAVKRLNAGDIRGGCEAITWWSKARAAGGKAAYVIRGLFERRKREKVLCLIGV